MQSLSYLHFYGKRSTSILILCMILISLPSCEKENKNSDVVSFYDLKGFINEQVVLLQKQKPSVSKTMMTNDQNANLVSNDVDWAKELELFISADINKSAYTKSYIISRPDSLTFDYRLKKGESAPVQQLKITLDKISGKPIEVSATLLTRNRLYESEKNLTLTCNQRAGEWRIVSYDVTGYQKLSILDAKKFRVAGQIQM